MNNVYKKNLRVLMVEPLIIKNYGPQCFIPWSIGGPQAVHWRSSGVHWVQCVRAGSWDRSWELGQELAGRELAGRDLRTTRPAYHRGPLLDSH